MNLAKINPEVQRFIWLEFSKERLLAIPVVVGLCWLVGDKIALFLLAGGLLILWGTRQAADSFLGEVTDGTWDNQRLSQMTAGDLLIGKLFGSTAFVWTSAGLALLVSLYFVETQPLELLIITIAGLEAQALSLLLALLLARQFTGTLRFSTTAAHLIGLIAGANTALGCFSAYYALDNAAIGQDFVLWYGLKFHMIGAMLFSTAAATLWAMVGIWSLFREELNERPLGIAWPAFMVFLVVFFFGFEIEAGYRSPDRQEMIEFLGSQAILVTSFQVLLFSVFFERKDVGRLQSCLSAWAKKDFAEAWKRQPLWLLPVILCSGLLTYFYLFDADQAASPDYQRYFWLAVFLFALRDCALFLGLTAGDRGKRTHFAALLYIGLIWGIGLALADVLELDWLIPLFRPLERWDDWSQGLLAIPALEALAATAFAIWRWRLKLKQAARV